jgi:cobalt transport protein ATP-binding subunit
MSIVHVNDLSYCYPNERSALKSVSFSMEAGEKVALIGPNGAGKSTLLLHLNGLLTGDGEIQIDGITLGRKTLREVRRRVGLVFQDPDDQLFMPTVLDDVAFGLLNQGLGWEEAARRALHTLEEVGMAEAAEYAPQHLSLGQKKRVALAGVLAMQPPVLVLDEPTAGLDPRARRQLIRLLERLPQTLLAATHDLEMALELCPRALIMDEGTIVAQGDTKILFEDTAQLERHGLEQPCSLRTEHRGTPL